MTTAIVAATTGISADVSKDYQLVLAGTTAFNAHKVSVLIWFSRA